MQDNLKLTKKNGGVKIHWQKNAIKYEKQLYPPASEASLEKSLGQLF